MQSSNVSNVKKRLRITEPSSRLLLRVVLVITLVAVVASFAFNGKGAPANTDPTRGWVKVNNGNAVPGFGHKPFRVYKKCDGSTMMYAANGRLDDISVVPNDPECR